MTETGPPTDTIVYKICPRADWLAACRDAVYAGAPIDRRDGFIHLSTAAQVRETAAKHFAGQTGLVVVGFSTDSFGAALKWERSRNDDLFPHLYAELNPQSAVSVDDLPLDGDGRHIFPDHMPPSADGRSKQGHHG